MAKKVFTYRGKTEEELNVMSHKELAKLMPSRQRRKITRGFSDEEKKLIEKLTKKDNVKTHLRNMIVLPQMVGKTIRIYTGKEFQAILLQPETIGHYFGELSLSRKKVGHSAPGVGATRSSSAASVR